MKKLLIAAAALALFGSVQAQTVPNPFAGVAGLAGSVSQGVSLAATGVVGTGAAVQGTTNATTGQAQVVSVAGTSGGTPVPTPTSTTPTPTPLSTGAPVTGAAQVNTATNTTSVGLSVGAVTGTGVGLTGGAAGSNANANGLGAFFHF